MLKAERKERLRRKLTQGVDKDEEAYEDRKKNLERGCCYINLKEHKVIPRKYYVQRLTAYSVFMLPLSSWLNKELESLHSSGFC